jgi:transcriptional regulator with XRE-family HTH domain
MPEITNEVLKAWRQSRGWSQDEMARRLVQAAKDCGQDPGSLDNIRRYVYRWEDPDDPRLPGEQRQLWYIRALGLSSLGELAAGPAAQSGQVERGERGESEDLARICDPALQSGHILFDVFPTGLRRGQPTPAHAEAATTETLAVNLASNLDLGRDDMRRRGFLVSSALGLGAAFGSSIHAHEAVADLRLVNFAGPSGRLFAGSSVRAAILPATSGDRVMVNVPTQLSGLIRRPEHALVIGKPVADGSRLYAADVRYVRHRLRHADHAGRVPIPSAYVLDELTLGLIWAITNLDDALLGDDAALFGAQKQIAELSNLDRSAAGRDLVADLSPLSQAWVGSDFCARHIIRKSDVLAETPTFWTCEKRGEEACGWLFFAHKFAYLQASTRGSSHRGTGSSSLTRAFCVPPGSVSTSGTPERVVLLLAAGLMESFGIRIEVCTDEAYGQIEGFVSDGRKAILANWVDSSSLWHVDVTDYRPTIAEVREVSGYASAHSVAVGQTPGARLSALASYLDLDWAVLARRCADVSEYGLGGLVAPRSRLLSSAGADRACQFVGSFK